MATNYDLIVEGYISKFDALSVKVQTRAGPREIQCRDYFTRSRIADIRAMFTEAEYRVTENGDALHKIHVWLKKAGEDLMKMFRHASVIYGNGTPWHDLKEIREREKGGNRGKEYDHAQHENNRQDDHLKAAMRLYEKIYKALEHEMQIEERNSWIFKDYYEFK